jgi:NodT family efflux transporter outer membrane factor (OMF) lipoprotein
MKPAHAWVAAAAVLFAGCNVGPKYERPSTPTPPSFREPPPAAFQETKGWKPGQPGDDKLRSDWWQIFEISELNDLESQIDPANQTLKQAAASFRQARTLIQLSRSGLSPTISTGPGISSNRTSNNVQGGSTGDYGLYTLPVDFGYEIDLWGRIHRSVTAAREEAQASAADVETVRLSLHAELAVDYFELRSLDAQKQLLDETIEAFQKALELTQNRFNGGLSSKAEVAQARTQLETARAQEIGVGVARAQYEHAIAVLIGRTPESVAFAPAPLASKPPAIPVGVPSELLERRPDIAAAERRMAEANEKIGIARTAFFPSLLLTATGGFQGGQIVNWLNWPSRFWAIGPGTLQTVFDAGRRRAVAESAEAAYDQAVATYQQAALTAFQEVEDNLSTLRILEQQSEAQRVAVQAAEDSLNLSLNQYKGGLVTYLDVVSAQDIALQNQSTEVDLLRRRMEASVLLIKALGGGWDASKLPT